MQKIYSKGYNGWSQLAILLVLVGGGILIGGLMAILVWKMMTGASILHLETDMLNPAYATASQTVQVVSSIFTLLIPVVCYAFICYRNGWAFLGFKEKLNPKHLLIILLLFMCSFPLMAALEEINKIIPLPVATRARFDTMEKKYNEQVLAMIQLKTWGQYIVSLFVIALVPALSEELIFRGGLQNMLTKWLRLPWVSILITSLIFSAIHLSWYGFFVRFTLGALLGVIFHYTKNIWLNILLHFINNAVVVTSLFFMGKRGEKMDMTTQAHLPIWVGGIALILVITLVKWLIETSSPIYTDDVILAQDSDNPFEENDLIR